MIKKTSYACVLAAATFGFAIHSASASTVRVGTCQAPHVSYATIQEAVDAAGNGDAVTICPGNYAEQVSITKSVSLHGVSGMDAPHVVVPAGGLVANTTTSDAKVTAAQILVSAGASANITGLVVDAADNNNTDCNLEMVGIYYKGASGLTRQSTVENQIGPVGHQNCQNGIGILVENPTVGTNSVTIENNTVQNFDKNGIVMRLAGSVGTIAHNTVTGIGPTDLLAQNGIELRDGASANITLNTVSDLVYTPETAGSAGIILYNLPSTLYQSPPTVQKNTISNAQFGVLLDGANGVNGNPIQVIANKISNVEWAGVELQSDNAITPPANTDYAFVSHNDIDTTTIYDGIDICGDNNTVTKNTVSNSNTESAIHLDALCTQENGDASGTSNTVSNNHVATACVGILSGPASDQNTLDTNHLRNVTHKTVFGSDVYSCVPPLARAIQHHKAKGKSSSRVAISP